MIINFWCFEWSFKLKSIIFFVMFLTANLSFAQDAIHLTAAEKRLCDVLGDSYLKAEKMHSNGVPLEKAMAKFDDDSLVNEMLQDNVDPDELWNGIADIVLYVYWQEPLVIGKLSDMDKYVHVMRKRNEIEDECEQAILRK